jgi:hypothetical protein
MPTNTFYKLLPQQVPVFWEAIKLACVSADEVKSTDAGPYVNELLHALLNNKAQCWLRLNEERRLVALSITRIKFSPQTEEKQLFIQVAYSWKLVPDDVWYRDLGILREYAKKEDCTSVGFISGNSRIWDIGYSCGFTEVSRTFSHIL